LAGLCRAFEEVTGWSLACHRGPKPIHPTEFAWTAPDDPGVGTSPGHVRLDLVRSASAVSNGREAPQPVRLLAAAIEELVGEFLKTQHALWQREAELAAAVPVVLRPDERRQLAGRLQSVLRGGAEAVGCQAAALYLLDEATTSLKLRASWGLPRERLADPERPLRGALADLEAMLGHAVVLEDTGLFQQWNPPENFPAAACVPVATPTTILGTLWVFCNSRRDFNDRETNILEVVAGRLASELERETLLQEGASGKNLKRQLDAAERIQRNQLPTISPLIEGWDLAAWTGQAYAVGGDFFDWFSLPQACVAFAVGDVAGTGIEAALVASALKAALRSHGQYHGNAGTLISQANLTLWTGSAGDQSASLFCGFIGAESGRVRYAIAGQPGAILIRPDRWESAGGRFPALGRSPETVYRQTHRELEPGEALIVFSEGFAAALKGRDGPDREARLAQMLQSVSHLRAKDLVTAARGCLQADPEPGQAEDRTVLVLKRAGQ
jgi:serine phosphatase RsbU (regulator of sigma subunit)